MRRKTETHSYATLARMPVAANSVTPDARTSGGFRRMWRALKQLFYEMAGALFGILALLWLNTAVRAWTRDTAHWLLAVVIAVAAIFVFFAVSSFRRAKKI